MKTTRARLKADKEIIPMAGMPPPRGLDWKLVFKKLSAHAHLEQIVYT